MVLSGEEKDWGCCHTLALMASALVYSGRSMVKKQVCDMGMELSALPEVFNLVILKLLLKSAERRGKRSRLQTN